MRPLIAATLLTAAALFCGAGCTERPSSSEVVEPPPPAVAAPEPTTETAEQADAVATASSAETPSNASAENGEQEASSGEAQPESGESGTQAEPEEPAMTGEILPQSDERELTTADFVGLDNWQLTLARNEIFARHGRPFQYKDIRDHFMALPWYTPDPDYTDAHLSLLEQRNAAFILKYQKLTYDIPAFHP